MNQKTKFNVCVIHNTGTNKVWAITIEKDWVMPTIKEKDHVNEKGETIYGKIRQMNNEVRRYYAIEADNPYWACLLGIRKYNKELKKIENKKEVCRSYSKFFNQKFSIC